MKPYRPGLRYRWQAAWACMRGRGVMFACYFYGAELVGGTDGQRCGVISSNTFEGARDATYGLRIYGHSAHYFVSEFDRHPRRRLDAAD